MPTITVLAALAWAVLPDTASGDDASPAAVVWEVKGEVFRRVDQRKVQPANAGDSLHADQVLLVAEDAEALVLYADGRYSRIRGPARAEIGTPASTSTRPADPTRRWLAAAFPATATRFSSTVGGVRDPDDLIVLSPLARGFTPSAFRLALYRLPADNHDVSLLVLADEVRVEIRQARSADNLLVLAVEPDKASELLRDVQVSRQGTRREHVLTVNVLQTNPATGEPGVVQERRSTFQVAPAGIEEALARDLAEIATAGRDGIEYSADTKALLRIGCFLERGFPGEALAEAMARHRADPGNLLWRTTLSNLAAEYVGRDLRLSPTN